MDIYRKNFIDWIVANINANFFITINSNYPFMTIASFKTKINTIITYTNNRCMRSNYCKNNFLAIGIVELTTTQSPHMHILFYIPEKTEWYIEQIINNSEKLIKGSTINIQSIYDLEGNADYVSKKINKYNAGESFEIYRCY